MDKYLYSKLLTVSGRVDENQFLCPQAIIEAENKHEALSFSAINLKETALPDGA